MKSELMRMQVQNARRPNVTSPDYLLNLADRNRSRGKKSSLDILFQVTLVEKQLMFYRTNHCLGCVGCEGLYVGRIYQNRAETFLG